MECEQVKDRLVEYLDGELSERRKDGVAKHLKECSNCSKEFESIRNIKILCQNWKDINSSEDWEMGLKNKLKKMQRQPESELEILRSAVIGLSQRIQKLEELQSNLPPTLEGEIMTVKELARYLRISTNQVYEIIEQIPKFQIGYEYRFVRESIDRWIRSMERNQYSTDYTLGSWYGEEDSEI